MFMRTFAAKQSKAEQSRATKASSADLLSQGKTLPLTTDGQMMYKG